jgi:hypothetical protein
MAREQHDRVSAERHAVVVRDDQWLVLGGIEPMLDELLDDPMMALLWRADGLEPATARATVRCLQALIACPNRRRSPLVRSDDARSRCIRSLAA